MNMKKPIHGSLIVVLVILAYSFLPSSSAFLPTSTVFLPKMPNCTASSDDGTNHASGGCDNNTATQWYTTAQYPDYFTVNLVHKSRLSYLAIYGWTGYKAVGFIDYWSSANSTWVRDGSFTITISGTQNETLSLTNVIITTAFRLEITGLAPGATPGPDAGFKEVWAYGYTDISVPTQILDPISLWIIILELIAYVNFLFIGIWLGIRGDNIIWLIAGLVPAGIIMVAVSIEAWTFTLSAYASLALAMVAIVTLTFPVIAALRSMMK